MIHNSFFKMKTPQMDGLPFYTPFQDMVLLKRSEQTSFFEFDLVIWSKPSSTLCSIYWLCHGHSCIQSLSFLKYNKIHRYTVLENSTLVLPASFNHSFTHSSSYASASTPQHTKVSFPASRKTKGSMGSHFVARKVETT